MAKNTEVYVLPLQDPIERWTRQQVLDYYWEHWCERVTAVGRQHLISEERCLEDFLVTHWAWVEYDDDSV